MHLERVRVRVPNIAMRCLLSICALVLSEISSCAAFHLAIAARAAPPSSDSKVENANLSALPSLPDKDFTYVSAYRTPSIPLPDLPIMMACIAAMQDLAMRDIDSMVSGGERWTHPDYPGASVFVTGETSTRMMKVRWAMFLINGGLDDMMYHHKYEFAIFHGWYRKVKVGTATFGPGSQSPLLSPRAPITARATAIMNQTQISFQRDGPGQAATLGTAEQLYAEVEYLEKALYRRDCIGMLTYMIMGLGHRNKAPLNVYVLKFIAITVEVSTIWNSHPAAPQWYVMTGGDMINMLAGLAVHIVRERRFAEMNVVIYDDGVAIARGIMRTKPRPPKQNAIPPRIDLSSS